MPVPSVLIIARYVTRLRMLHSWSWAAEMYGCLRNTQVLNNQAQAKSPLAVHEEKTTRSPHSLKIAVGHNGEVMKRHTECSYDQHRPR